METLTRVSKIICSVLDEERSIDLNTVAADFDGWDSLGNIRVFLALEEEFGIEFTTHEVTHLSNVGSLIEAIDSKGKQ